MDHEHRNRNVCPRCNGGCELPSADADEQARGITDVCYHCGGEGYVDDETARHDQVADLAVQIAHRQVSARRRQDEDFGLCAAERGLSEYDFFTLLVQETADRFATDLLKLDAESPGTMDALLNFARPTPDESKADDAPAPGSQRPAVEPSADDDVLF